MIYTLTAIQANGAMILRSDRKQDALIDAREMLAAVRKVYPSEKFKVKFNYPFLTFDGDRITQISVSPANIFESLPHYTHGSEMTF